MTYGFRGRKARYCSNAFDLKDGWWIIRERVGAGVSYHAMKLDQPDGYVVNGLSRSFWYRREADAWIAAKKSEIAA